MSKIRYSYKTPTGAQGAIVCKYATDRKTMTYRGVVGVYEDGNLIYAEKARIASLNPYDATCVAQDLASHIMAQNGINAFIVSHY